MMIWTIAMAGEALPGNTLDRQVEEDLTRCVEALLEIREMEAPGFAGCCAECESSGQKMAWTTNKLLDSARLTASNVLREIARPVECEFCNEGYVGCSGKDCFGGNTRDGGYCPICRGSGAVRCEHCDGKGEY